MAATALGGFLDRVRASAGPADDLRPDAALLAAFADRRDPAAFAVLVRRHAGLVWAVCRRVTGDPHAAEDAFQAVWLVLARKAASVRPRHSLGGWLHRTAVHISLKARAMTDRRRRREGEPLPDAPAPLPPAPPDPALLAALDEEIARLPDALRAAVVLCELEGVPRKPAAAQLGVAEGTLSSRLASARKRLADRLRRRGFGAVGVAGLLAAGIGGATVPPGPLAAAIGLGSGGAVPNSVRILTEGVMRAMFLSKLKLTTAVCGLALTTAIGLWPASTPRAVAQPPAKPRPAAPALYYPTKVGAKWTYKFPKAEISYIVTRVEEKDGKKVVSVGQVEADGTVKRHAVVAVSVEGLTHLETVVAMSRQTPDGGFERAEDGWKVRDVPLPLLKLPAKPGDTWSIQQPDGLGVKYTVGAEEWVKVPAGEFVALPVEMLQSIHGVPWCWYRHWYAPGVGAVKWTFGMADEAERESVVMTAFSPGKD